MTLTFTIKWCDSTKGMESPIKNALRELMAPAIITSGGMNVFYKLVGLALAGALGTLSRYLLSGLIYKIDGASFPWGTIVVNLLGCFFAGFFWALFENRMPISSTWRVSVMVGFMGAFTTFSTMIYETGELAKSAAWWYALSNILIQNCMGFILLVIGHTLGRNL